MASLSLGSLFPTFNDGHLFGWSSSRRGSWVGKPSSPHGAKTTTVPAAGPASNVTRQPEESPRLSDHIGRGLLPLRSLQRLSLSDSNVTGFINPDRLSGSVSEGFPSGWFLRRKQPHGRIPESQSYISGAAGGGLPALPRVWLFINNLTT